MERPNCSKMGGPTIAPKDIPDTAQLAATATHIGNRLSNFDRLNAAFVFSLSIFSSGRRMSAIVIGCK